MASSKYILNVIVCLQLQIKYIIGSFTIKNAILYFHSVLFCLGARYMPSIAGPPVGATTPIILGRTLVQNQSIQELMFKLNNAC